MAGQQLGEVSRNGGWRGSPNSIAALMRHQVQAPDQRHCSRCRRIALRGRDRCAQHLGGNHTPVMSDGAGRGERRLLQRLDYLGLLPFELLALPAWRGLAGLATKERAPLRLAMLQAWDKRQVAPLHWAKVQRQALDLAQRPGQRRPNARFADAA